MGFKGTTKGDKHKLWGPPISRHTFGVGALEQGFVSKTRHRIASLFLFGGGVGGNAHFESSPLFDRLFILDTLNRSWSCACATHARL